MGLIFCRIEFDRCQKGYNYHFLIYCTKYYYESVLKFRLLILQLIFLTHPLPRSQDQKITHLFKHISR